MRNRIRAFIAVIAVLLSLTVSQAQARFINERSELQMGHDAARQVEARYKVSTDRKAIALVENIGWKLAKVSSRPDLNWQFKVLETDEINALSVPGYVYVNRGLLNFVGNDRDALAAVIGHEIAHTTARHAIRAAEDRMKYGLALQFLFRRDSARQWGNMAANLTLMGYGRRAEFEADKLGVEYMMAAGYEPQGAIRFFRKLQEREGRDPGGLTVYFRSHPPTSERIARIEAQLAASNRKR